MATDADKEREAARKRLEAKRARAEASSGGGAGVRDTSAERAAARERLLKKQEMAGGRGQAAAAGPSGAPSLVDQGKHILGSIPRALGVVAGQAGAEVVNTLAQVGTKIPALAPAGAVAQKMTSTERLPGESSADYFRRTHPLVSESIASGKRTVHKTTQGVASLAPGGLAPTDTQYAQDIREGRILGSALEDVANLSVAFGGAGRALGAASRVPAISMLSPPTAARLAQASNVTGNLRNITGAAASTPFKPYIYGVKYAGKALRKSGIGPALADIPVTKGMTERLVANNRIPATLVADAGRATVGQIASARLAAMAENRAFRADALDPFGATKLHGLKRIEKLTERAVKVLPDTDAHKAMILTQSAQFDVVRALRSIPDPAIRKRMIEETWGIDHAPSERTMDLAIGYVDDTLDPSYRAKMTEAWPYLRAIQKELHEPQRLAGEGMDAPMSPEQLGDVPMEGAIAREMSKPLGDIERTERLLVGDPRTGRQGLRARVAAQRAAVGTPDLAAAIPQQAIGRVERAARTAAEADVLRRTEARTAGVAQRAMPTEPDASAPFFHATFSDVAEQLQREGRFTQGGGFQGSGVYIAESTPVNRDLWGGIVTEKLGAAGRGSERPTYVPVRANVKKVFERESGRRGGYRGDLQRGDPSLVARFDALVAEQTAALGGRVSATLEQTAFRRTLEEAGYDAVRIAHPAGATEMLVFDPANVSVATKPVSARSQPFPTPDPAILADAERAARAADEAAAAARSASGEARAARGAIAGVETPLRAEKQAVARARAERRAEYKRQLYEEQGEYDRIYGGGERVIAPPKPKRVGSDPLDRRKPIMQLPDSGTWDWWNSLGKAEQRRLEEKGWVVRNRPGVLPDEIADFAARANNDPDLATDVNRAMEDWLERTRRIDELAKLARSGQGPEGLTVAAELAAVREKGPGGLLFDEPSYTAQAWADDYAETLDIINTSPKGSPEREAALLHYREIVPEGLHAAAAGKSFEQAFEVADRLARQQAAEAAQRAATPVGRLAASEEKVRAAVEARSAKGLTKPERALYNAVQASVRGEVAETALSAARARAVDRIVAAAAPALRAQGRAVGRAEGRAATLAGESSLASFMAAAREARLLGMDPQADLVAGMGVARRRLAPQISREVRAGLSEQRVAVIERRLERLRDSAAARERWLREGYVDPSRARADAVPGRYALPLLVANRAGRAMNLMADELDAAAPGSGAGDYLRAAAATLPQQMLDLNDRLAQHGLDIDYVPGAPEERLSGGAGIPGGSASLPIKRRLMSSKQKVEGRTPNTFKGLGRAYAKEFAQTVENIAADHIVSRGYALDARTLLRDAGMDPVDIERLVTGRSSDLALRMKREGFSEFAPSGRPRGQEGQGPNTLYLPTPLERQFRRYFQPARRGGWWELIDAPTRTWKHTVLAMNPMWNIGNAVSATLLTTVGAGLTPREVYVAAREALAILKRENATGVLELPATLHGTGPAAEMLRGILEAQREWSILPERILSKRRPGGAYKVPENLRHPIRLSYRMNQFVDDWGRSTVYLAKKKKGLSDEDSVKLGLRAMGNYSHMTPFERDIVRRFLPFYAWTRHVTQLAGHLALEHPVRVAWTMHLGANYGGGAEDAVEGVPSFLAGAIKLPEGGIADSLADRLLGENDVARYVSIRSLNPYADIATLPFTSPKEAARGLNPVGKGLAHWAGLNLGKWRGVTRPPGHGGRSEYGGEEWRASNLAEMLYWLSQQNMQGRLAHATVAEPYVRHDSGDPMKPRGVEIPLEGGRREAIIRNLGIPFVPTSFSQEKHDARIAAVRRADERKRRNYAR